MQYFFSVHFSHYRVRLHVYYSVTLMYCRTAFNFRSITIGVVRFIRSSGAMTKRPLQYTNLDAMVKLTLTSKWLNVWDRSYLQSRTPVPAVAHMFGKG